MQQGSFALEDTPLFRALTSEEVARLQGRVHLRAFKPKASLLECGHDAPGLYVIRSGVVAVLVQDGAGEERELTRLGKGECIGDMALTTGEPCSATVRALNDTETWFIERGDFVELVDRCPGLWRNLGHILSQRLVRTSRHLGARPSADTTALIMGCSKEEDAALSVAIAASLARHTGKRILLVDARDSPAHSLLKPTQEVPGLWEVLHEPSLLREHEVPPDRANGLLGARIARLSTGDACPPTEEETLTTLDWLRPSYDHFLLLLPWPPVRQWPLLLDRASSIVAVVAEEQVSAFLLWLDQHRSSSRVEGNVEVAVVAPTSLGPHVRQAVAARVGRPPRWLPRQGLSRQVLEGRAPLAEISAQSLFAQGVDRLARHIGGMEVGLALGAGAAKGFAHIGVLRVLEENAVPIDYIAGCSIGAVVGALYATGSSPSEIEGRLQGADHKLRRWTIPLTAIWSDAGLRQLLRDPSPTVQFHDLGIPFAAIATDLGTGREVVLQDGLVWRAVLSSVSIPGIFPPTVVSGRYLVDGGLVNPVPSKTARDMGADIVIAVDVSSPTVRAERATGYSRGAARMARGRAPNLVEMLWRSTEIMQGEITTRTAADADVTIRPGVGRSRWSDFSRRGQTFAAAGEQAARNEMSELHRLLPFLNSLPGVVGSLQ